MPVKLIHYWNVLHGHKAEFDSFFIRQFVQQIDITGLMKIVGSWHVASGEGPYFIAEGVSNSVDEVESLIMSSEYLELRNKLFRLVGNYSTKLLVPTGRISTQPIEIEHGYKFNQHFNINAADYYAYTTFAEKEHIPRMQSFGIEMVGGWHVDVGATPYVISEGRTKDLSSIGAMLENPDYHALTLKLLSMVSNYGCKVLVPSGHVNT